MDNENSNGDLGAKDAAEQPAQAPTFRASMDTPNNNLNVSGRDSLDDQKSSPSCRKHSSGDLHSRLKTRKILGVGETDNGDIHRSKISQLLGHNEHLYVKFPRGYWCWHLIMAVAFTLFGLNNLFFPDKGLAVDVPDEDVQPTGSLSSRFYGSVSLAIAFLLWVFWGTSDKYVARSLLTAISLCHILQTIAVIMEHWHDGWSWSFYFSAVARVLVVLPNMYFYRGIEKCNSRMRKSNSFTNLRDCTGSSTSGSSATKKD